MTPVNGVLAGELLAACGDDAIAVSMVIRTWGERRGVNFKQLTGHSALTDIVDVVARDVRNRLGLSESAGEQHWPCDAIAQLRPRFDRARAAWTQFATQEPELTAALLRSCHVGLSWLRPGDTNTPPFL